MVSEVATGVSVPNEQMYLLISVLEKSAPARVTCVPPFVGPEEGTKLLMVFTAWNWNARDSIEKSCPLFDTWRVLIPGWLNGVAQRTLELEANDAGESVLPNLQLRASDLPKFEPKTVTTTFPESGALEGYM
jgi:hypothetical protein